MMRRCIFLMFVCAGLFAITGGLYSKPLGGNGEEVRLCTALNDVFFGGQQEVFLSGILDRFSVFFDPFEPVCAEDIQPSTFALFEINLPEEAQAILREDGRLFLTVHGVIEGPRAQLQSGTESVPALRVSDVLNCRYGFNRMFRTRLRIDEIGSFSRVPDGMPSAPRIAKGSSAKRKPKLVRSILPEYPDVARKLGVQGLVIFREKIENGEVSLIEVKYSEDPILEKACREFVESWVLDYRFSGSVDTTCEYQLEMRLFPGDENARIDARLPRYVKITGPYVGW